MGFHITLVMLPPDYKLVNDNKPLFKTHVIQIINCTKTKFGK